MISEWALRYGSNLAGWYFDDAFNWDGWSDETKPYNFKTWAAAARQGNPQAVLTFNSRKVEYFARKRKKQPAEMDYMPGEIADAFSRPPDRDQWSNAPDTLWHLMPLLAGKTSEVGYPQIMPDDLPPWTQHLIKQGGTATFDVGVWSVGDRHGYIPPWQMEALRNTRMLIRDHQQPASEIPAGMVDLTVKAIYAASSISRFNRSDLNDHLFDFGAGQSGDAWRFTGRGYDPGRRYSGIKHCS